jgi:hypothetical protein
MTPRRAQVYPQPDAGRGATMSEARTATARLLLVVLAAVAGVIPTGVVHAQSVTGEVVGAGDNAPIMGAFVILFDAQGNRHAGTLTDRTGRYALRAREPGDYTLRVEQIGFQTVTSPVLMLGAAGAYHRFVVPIRAVTLPEITVATERRCRRTGDEGAVYAVWEEVRKALELAEFTESSGGLHYTAVQQVSDTDRHAAYLLREQRQTLLRTSSVPFAAAAAPEVMIEDGFARVVDGEVVLLGPDADVLLSPEFASAYCFRLVPGTRAGEVGLGFEPAERSPGRVDLSGVLWLHHATAELRRLEFVYLGLPAGLAGYDVGGEVHFRRIPTGRWIVSEWWLTSPLREYDGFLGVVRAAGMRREGATVIAARQGTTLLYQRTGGAALTGRVDDAFFGEPRRGIVVSLVGTPYSTVTDRAGRYAIEGLPAGSYAVAAIADWMTELRTPAPLRSITLPDSGAVQLQLTTPDFGAAMRQLCPDTPSRRAPLQQHGVIYGVARHRDTGEPLPNVTIRAEYDRRLHHEVTDEEGRYAFCWVTRSETAPVAVRIWTRQHRTLRMPLLLQQPLLRHDFH